MQTTAAASAAATTAAAATAIVSDLNTRLSKFYLSLGPDAWHSKGVERCPRESTPQVDNTVTWSNNDVMHRSTYEQLMQYESSDSIFPPPLVQDLACTSAQDIITGAGDAESSPVDGPTVPNSCHMLRVRTLVPATAATREA